MEWALGLILSPVGRIVSCVTALLAAFGIWLATHDHNLKSQVRADTLSQVTEGARKLDEKGVAARAAADKPGAADRLRKRYCRDCGAL